MTESNRYKDLINWRKEFSELEKRRNQSDSHLQNYIMFTEEKIDDQTRESSFQ